MKTQIKYPFMISELFANENTKLIDYLFGKKDAEDSDRKNEEAAATPDEDEP
jgi:hypothetical protein